MAMEQIFLSRMQLENQISIFRITKYEHREREVVMDSFIRMYEPVDSEENRPVRTEL